MINDSYANNNFNELNHISVSKSNEKGQIYNNLIRNNLSILKIILKVGEQEAPPVDLITCIKK
jgi:hypothetical protein